MYMLQLSQTLLNKSVLSLRTNMPIANVISVIFNPDNLKIEGFYCEDRFNKAITILLPQDIRETLNKGYIVNDHDALVEPEDLIRLKDVIDMKYQLIGKQVETIGHQKIGKVSDYATEIETMQVQKLYVSRSVLKSFYGGTLSVDRSQIIETTPSKIIINDLLEKVTAPAPIAVA